MTKSARRLSAALLAAPFIVVLSGTAALAAPASAAPTGAAPAGAAAPVAKSVTPNGGAVTECLMWGVCPPSAE